MGSLIILIKKSIKSLKNNHFLEYAREWHSSRNDHGVDDPNPCGPLVDLVGAYAGEIGQTQFLPSSYIKYGVDYDGNVRVDLRIWPDPVETRVLLQEISAKTSKYIVMRPEAVTATVLWTTMAWAQEGATHSPILAAILSNPIPARAPSLVFYVFWCRNRLSASNRLVPAYTVQSIANTQP